MPLYGAKKATAADRKRLASVSKGRKLKLSAGSKARLKTRLSAMKRKSAAKRSSAKRPSYGLKRKK